MAQAMKAGAFQSRNDTAGAHDHENDDAHRLAADSRWPGGGVLAAAPFSVDERFAIIATGVNDALFPGASMKPPADMSEIAFHPIDSGHFALEDHSAETGSLTRGFLDRVIGRARSH